MSWFKVDDRLHDHRKTRKIRRSDTHKSRDVAPFGLWVLAGSWCGANRTGGFIPFEVLEEWDEDVETLAERLVEAGLWWHDEQDGEDGYRFHDWGSHNPHPEGMDDPLEAGRRGNHLRWHERRGIVDPDCTICTPDSPRDIAPESPPESPPSRVATRPPSRVPGPSRPDPTDTCASTDVEREFETWWSSYPRKRGKGQAVKAYRKARKTASAETLLDALKAQTPHLTAKGDEFVPYPATWLNGERWADEIQAAPQPKQRHLIDSRDLELPPDGLSPAEYAEWDRKQRAKRRA